MKILIIDAKKHINLLYLKCSKDPEYSVLDAENGFDTIASIRTCIPDFVLMLIDTPQTDGYQTTPKMRQILTEQDLRHFLLPTR